jgi:hypothetical protein
MSPELEALDQLLGGESIPLATIRALFPNADTFIPGILGLLRNGDVRLLEKAETEVPRWRWRELFGDGSVQVELNAFQLEITEQGVRRMG